MDRPNAGAEGSAREEIGRQAYNPQGNYKTDCSPMQPDCQRIVAFGYNGTFHFSHPYTVPQAHENRLIPQSNAGFDLDQKRSICH